MRTTRTIHAVTAVGVLLLASCGGGDDDAASDGSDAEPTSAAEQSAGAAEPATGDDDSAEAPADEPAAEPSSGGGENVAVVTIGGETYEIDVTPGSINRCDPDFFGAFWALGGDRADASIELMLPPPDDPNFDDPPTVKVQTDDGDVEWIADPSREMAGVEPGGSQVDDFSVDGNTASGTATFVDLNETYAFQGGVGEAPVSVTGTFSVTCSSG
jgi:hypothetical protein